MQASNLRLLNLGGPRLPRSDLTCEDLDFLGVILVDIHMNCLKIIYIRDVGWSFAKLHRQTCNKSMFTKRWRESAIGIKLPQFAAESAKGDLSPARATESWISNRKPDLRRGLKIDKSSFILLQNKMSSSKASSKPRLSASVVLLRRKPSWKLKAEGSARAPQERSGVTKGSRAAEDNDFEVLLAQRSSKMKSFSSMYVFPGGVAEEGDADVAKLYGCNSEIDAAKLTGIRELFEEAGVLLSAADRQHHAQAVRMPKEETKIWQTRVHDDAAQFQVMLEKYGKIPAISALHYWITFITPVIEPRRFNTNFFVAIVDNAEVSVDGGETVRYTWASPREALDLHADGKMAMLPPQFYVLTALNEYATINELASACVQRKPRVPIQPHATGPPKDGLLTLAYPGDEEHPDYRGEKGDRRRVSCVFPFGSGGYRWICTLTDEPTIESWNAKRRASTL